MVRPMEEFQHIARMVAEADLIIKAVLAVLLGQSVYIWYALFQYVFRARQVQADHEVMIGALVDANIDGIRRVLLSFARLRAKGVAAMERDDAANLDGVMDEVWTEVYESLTAKCSGLATIAATAPFIGLFGTVWGILVAFSSIRNAETITFSALAPAIGEALFATMAGLFVAIPSVIANNWVTSRALLLSRRTAHSYLELVKELGRLARKPGSGAW
jgi:biopolymer transport protein TolQ